jgi:hypothetical protein
MEFEDESTWLRHRVLRLRTILRYAKDSRAESGLRELIAEAEKRLEQLETIRQAKESQKLLGQKVLLKVSNGLRGIACRNTERS